MRKVYESPIVEIVSFEAMEQLALLSPRGEGPSTDIGGSSGPTMSGGVTDRSEFDW